MTGRTGSVDGERDFFISYAGADAAWAEWIADILERAGYTTVLQAWDFRPGEVFVQRMHQAVEQARRILLVLSPAYLESAFATAEWQAAFAKDPTGDHALLLPVRIAACQPPGLLRGRTYLDLVGLAERAAAERLLAGVGTERIRPSGQVRFPGPATAVPGEQARRFPARWPAIFGVPLRNPHFTGRSDLLARLRRQLAETKEGAVVQASAVHGLGGVGKTQLVIEYAHRYASDYDLVWWVTAEQPAAIPGQLVVLARRLGIPEATEQADTIAALWDELRGRDRWLVVFDNAEDPSDLRPWWPPGSGRVVVTSRNPAWGGLAASIPLDVLPRAEAVAFLRRRLGREDPAFEVLAAALGDLPLALEQAAAYLEANDVGPVDYLSLLRDRARELFALGHTAATERTVATTWTVSLDRFREQVPAAEDLLALCAFLAADDIPRDLPAQHPDLLPDQLAAAVGDPLAYQQAVGTLRRYSLITTTGDTFRLHRLVQAVTRQSLSAEDRQRWGTAAVRLVLASFPDRAEEADTWPAAARMLPHGLAVTDHPAADMTDPQATVRLLNRITDYLWGRGDYAEAKPLAERACSTAESRLGPDHLDTAQSLNNLAEVLYAQGDLDRARRLHERALAIHETHLGPDHPTTAHSLNNLAYVLRAQGDLDRARRLHERALAIFEARLGPDHPETAWSLRDLGVVLADPDDPDGARSLYERALASYEARLGADHPDTVRSRQDLAAVVAKLDAQQ
jgi:tetratricopeptide (TPR) repeat protein